MEQLCGHYLSITLNPLTFLCESGLANFISGPVETCKIFGKHFNAEITGINVEAYNALGLTNPLLQIAVCHWFHRIDLLYSGGPRILDKSKKSWGGESKYYPNDASRSVVRLPPDFNPKKKFDYRKHIEFPSITRSCKIDVPSKFNPSILVLNEDQLFRMRHSFLEKQDKRLLYLRSERNRAVALSLSRQPKWKDEKKALKIKLQELKNSDCSTYIAEMAIGNVIQKIKSLKRKIRRADEITEKYFKTVQKDVVSMESDARDAETNVLRTREKILDLKKRIEEIVSKMQELLKKELLGETESKRSSAKKEREMLHDEVEKIRQSIRKCEQEIPELESIARAFRFKATSIQNEIGFTIESIDRYLDIVQRRTEYQDIEQYRLGFVLSDFDKNNDCIHLLDEFIKNIDQNLQEISVAVEENWRHQMSASFDSSTKMVTLKLNYEPRVITLSHYIHHLKEGTRKSDIKRLEEYIGKLCSNLTEWIASLCSLDPRIEQDLSKIRDTVKLYWRASFDVSTKMVCLIHETEKVEHLSIPEYIEYLRGRLRHFEEILEEKMKQCGYFQTKECCICMDSDSTDKWSILQCGHKFHSSCISMWTRSKQLCPICKSEKI